MPIINNKLYWLYSFLIYLTLYTDSPLSIYLGAFGESMLPCISLCLYVLFVLTNRINKTDSFVQQFSFLIKVTTILSLVAFLIYPILGISYTQLGESLFAKFIKLWLTFQAYICYLLLLINIAGNYTIERILKPFFGGFILLTIILLIEFNQSPYAFTYLHTLHADIYYRIRLLTPESSATALMLEVFFALSVFYTYYIRKNKILLGLVLICAGLHISLSGSKTLLAIVCISGVLFFFQNIKYIFSFKGILVMMGFLIGGGYILSFIVPKLIESSMNDLENYTSVVTRFYSMFIGYSIGVCFPLGTGFQTYMYLFPEMMRNNLYLIDMINMPLRSDEIISLVNNGNDNAVTAKSFLGQSSIYWGIIGTFLFIRNYLRLCKYSVKKLEKGNILFKVLFVLIVIQLLFSSVLDYCVIALFFVHIRIKDNYKPVKMKMQWGTSANDSDVIDGK
ncbi:hypothetical protein [uncultured Bacteroides sp.]|uniref:hypothetical protein n=1 Tax=uncultured Bacteroides sp. TaxID=162156 RepID=UPI0025F7E8FC|nr:hypothetical protein [uncultured Bacteroides sp.]